MTLKSRLIAAASVFTLIASGCATTQQGQPTHGGGSSTVEELPNEGGHQDGAQAAPAGPQLNDVGSTEEGFTAKMPGTPGVTRNKVTIPTGDVTIATWNSNINGVIYALTVADYPEKFVAARTVETMLNREGRDSVVGQLKGTLKSEENVTSNDGAYPGKAFVVSSDNGEVKARSYLVGTRLYTLLALYNPSIGAPAADEFLKSLNLINKPPMISKDSAPAAPEPGTPSGTPGTETPEGAAPAGTPGTGTPEGAAPAGTPTPPPNPGTK